MLPSDKRLRDNRDFRRVYSRGRSHAASIAVLHVLRRTGEASAAAAGLRIGFVVSKKQGDAVVRNRIKRRLREAVRQLLPSLRDCPSDLVFVGRSRSREASWPEILAAVEELLTRGGLRDVPPARAEPEE